MRTYERALILEAVSASNGDVARVIDLLAIPRETF
jgi:DNA-binding NtrC family response regulator